MTFSMKSLPLVALIAGAAAAPAFAGGYQEPVATPAPVVEAAPVLTYGKWAGGYVGAFTGYADDKADSGIAGDPNPKGAELGLNAGYNWQSGNWVYGVEGDIASTNFSDTGDNGLKADIKSKATLRGKLGYDMGNWMPYATLGYTVADIDYSGLGAKDSDTAQGYVAGVGAEYAVNDRWSVKGEYLYSKFDSSSFKDGIVDTDFDHSMNEVRVGVNYNF